MIPSFHDYSVEPKITRCGDPLYSRLVKYSWVRNEFVTVEICEKIVDSEFKVHEVRAEICQKFGWFFGRFEDTKISF